MDRRDFIRTATAVPIAACVGSATVAGAESATAEDFPAPPPLGFRNEKSNLRITGVRAVNPRRKKPWPKYEPTPGSWTTGGVEVASPMSIYPKYKARRSSFLAEDLGPSAVEITTDKGVRGIGYGGPGAGFVAEKHLEKLLLGEDPFATERLWDILWRSTLYYGRKGLVVHGISAVDNALWDIVGQALKMPVYKLLGGTAKSRVPGYCTGNDIEQHVEFGFSKLKLAIPHGPADGKEGLRKNVALVKRARDALGLGGEILLDCWMAFDEAYSMELAAALEPYRVYWMEECLPPDDYRGYRRLRKAVRSTRIVTGEHEYTRWGFRLLLDYEAAEIWQPDMNWCGGLSELRHIDALGASRGIPVIPHGGWRGGGAHYVFSSTNVPWCEMFMPAPGGPPEVYQRFEEENGITRGPEGIYMRPPEKPGFGWELEV